MGSFPAFPPSTPAPPPDIRPQMVPPAPPGPMMAQVGGPSMASMVDPLGILEGKIKEFEILTGDIYALAGHIHPPLKAFLPVIAQAGMAMQQEIAKLRERGIGPSPEIPSEMAPPPSMGASPAVA